MIIDILYNLHVYFFIQKNGALSYFAPPLSDDDFNKQVGKYSQSIFMSQSTRALTATSVGNLVVWDTNKPLTKGRSDNYERPSQEDVNIKFDIIDLYLLQDITYLVQMVCCCLHVSTESVIDLAIFEIH